MSCLIIRFQNEGGVHVQPCFAAQSPLLAGQPAVPNTIPIVQFSPSGTPTSGYVYVYPGDGNGQQYTMTQLQQRLPGFAGGRMIAISDSIFPALNNKTFPVIGPLNLNAVSFQIQVVPTSGSCNCFDTTCCNRVLGYFTLA